MRDWQTGERLDFEVFSSFNWLDNNNINSNHTINNYMAME